MFIKASFGPTSVFQSNRADYGDIKTPDNTVGKQASMKIH